LRAAVVGACDRPEKVRPWIFEVESKDKTLEGFATNKADRLRALAAKLAEALMKVVRGEPARRIAVEAEKIAKDMELLSGRQLFYLVYQEFKRDEHKSDAVAYSNLEVIKIQNGEAGPDTFLKLWDSLLLTFKTQPSADHLFQAFYGRVRHISALAPMVQYVDRLEWGHEHKTYDYVMKSVRMLVDQRKSDKQLAE